jgi:hypothetical protein
MNSPLEQHQVRLRGRGGCVREGGGNPRRPPSRANEFAAGTAPSPPARTAAAPSVRDRVTLRTPTPCHPEEAPDRVAGAPDLGADEGSTSRPFQPRCPRENRARDRYAVGASIVGATAATSRGFPLSGRRIHPLRDRGRRNPVRALRRVPRGGGPPLPRPSPCKQTHGEGRTADPCASEDGRACGKAPSPRPSSAIAGERETSVRRRRSALNS